MARLGDYEVIGPNGEYYGRYTDYPPASKIPIYAMVKKVNGGEFRLGEEGLFGFGQSAEDLERRRQREEEAVRKMKGFMTMGAVIPGVVFGAGAVLLFWGASKWKSPWNIVGYTLGTLSGLGSLSAFAGAAMFRTIFGMAEEDLKRPRLEVKAPVTTAAVKPPYDDGDYSGWE